MKVAIIDDDPLTLKNIGQQLGVAGLNEVVAYQSSESALTDLRAGGYQADIIFCDIHMSGMDGVEMVRHLAAMNSRPGVVLLSETDDRILQTVALLAQIYGLNILGWACKPVTSTRLQQFVSAHSVAHTACQSSSRKTYGAEEIRRAISRDELVLYYQPKVSLRTGKVVGVEALVRWRHPEDGLVFPGQFIEVAELYDLINDLTLHILRSAAQQYRQWSEAGLTWQVAINGSMSNLSSLSFPEKVSEVIEDTHVPLGNLIFEVTESQMMYEPYSVLEVLARLRLKGLDLSIDDFGTGHSSLANLRDIPFNELKVDAGFVHDAVNSNVRSTILNASLHMAKQMGIGTVAEGVETEEDWCYLRDCTECDVVQGYFVGRPMPPDLFNGWLGSWESRTKELISL